MQYAVPVGKESSIRRKPKENFLPTVFYFWRFSTNKNLKVYFKKRNQKITNHLTILFAVIFFFFSYFMLK